jgi:5-methylcytosine-specific restriction endonuclease McrA
MKSFPKKKRVKSERAIQAAKAGTCLICGTGPVQAHHVQTKGAGGDDSSDNLVALCVRHHNLFHAKGIGYMNKTFYTFREWIIKHGREDLLRRT